MHVKRKKKSYKIKESACEIIGKVDKSKLDLNGKLVHGIVITNTK